MKILYLTFLALLISAGVFGQYRTYLSWGDRAFNNKDYFTAAALYKKAAEGKKALQTRIPFHSGPAVTKKQMHDQYPFICYRVAESCRLYQDYSQAAEWYNKVISEEYEAEYPLSRLWYGVCLRAKQNFDGSIKQLQLFISNYKGNKKILDVAKRELEISNYARQQYQSHASVAVTKMGAGLNNGGGDYALVKNGTRYWFTSTRFIGNDKFHVNKIYTLSVQNPSPIVFDVLNDNKIKGVEYGTMSIDPAGKRLYFTRWYQIGGTTSLAIYSSELVNNAWSAPQKLNNVVNEAGYNALQPSVTPDGKRLFFSSDRPGGQGGYDIWVSNLDKEGNPVDATNLGNAINTPFDEQAPFYDSRRNSLMFSSKGFTGMGGFDLFESFENSGQWSTPENLGYPINSSKDDMYYFADPDDLDKFYISSDRESACCLNLFEGSYKHNIITGTIIDCDTHKGLQHVKVSLTDSNSKKSVAETGINGEYTFDVVSDGQYKVVFEKDGYLAKTTPVSMKRRIDTLINPAVCMQAYKVDHPIVIKNILYDFNKYELRAESKTALDGVVAIMMDNPGIKIELASHTDSLGSDAYNLKLSLQRAKVCGDYIISKGVSNDRITAKGYGKSRPVEPNSLPNGRDNPAGRQSNRRTEFVVKH